MVYEVSFIVFWLWIYEVSLIRAWIYEVSLIPGPWIYEVSLIRAWIYEVPPHSCEEFLKSLPSSCLGSCLGTVAPKSSACLSTILL